MASFASIFLPTPTLNVSIICSIFLVHFRMFANDSTNLRRVYRLIYFLDGFKMLFFEFAALLLVLLMGLIFNC